MMQSNEFYCKRDVWFNRPPDHDIALKDSNFTLSKELGFEKLYDTSRLVFKKGETYKVNNFGTGIDVYSTLERYSYYFEFSRTDKYLYFFSAFLPLKWQRKIKIMKLLKRS